MLGHLTPGSSQMNHWKHSKYSLQCRSTAGLLRDGMVQREMSYTNTHFTHAHTHTQAHLRDKSEDCALLNGTLHSFRLADTGAPERPARFTAALKNIIATHTHTHTHRHTHTEKQTHTHTHTHTHTQTHRPADNRPGLGSGYGRLIASGTPVRFLPTLGSRRRLLSDPSGHLRPPGPLALRVWGSDLI